MCEQCTAQVLLWRKPIVPGFGLVKAQIDGHFMRAGWYGLLECNDPSMLFGVEPEKDPYWGMTDNEIDKAPKELHDQFMDWSEKVEVFEQQLMTHIDQFAIDAFNADKTPWTSPNKGTDLMTVYALIEACKEAGWDKKQHGSVQRWLLHRIAVHIETEKEIEDVGYVNGDKERNPIAIDNKSDYERPE